VCGPTSSLDIAQDQNCTKDGATCCESERAALENTAREARRCVSRSTQSRLLGPPATWLLFVVKMVPETESNWPSDGRFCWLFGRPNTSKYQQRYQQHRLMTRFA